MIILLPTHLDGVEHPGISQLECQEDRRWGSTFAVKGSQMRRSTVLAGGIVKQTC
jgi:hypothetical protein